MSSSLTRKAFTLIELLIVVAIIAILAAIAVPNFLEAQVRAKVSRAKNDLRVIDTAHTAYYIDHNTLLRCNGNSSSIRVPQRVNSRETFERLTTPIAYLTGQASFTDPFKPRGIWDRPWTTVDPFPARDIPSSIYYAYTARNYQGDANVRWDEPDDAKPNWCMTESSGPDAVRHNMLDALNFVRGDTPAGRQKLYQAIYDPTNGTVSRGSIWRCNGVPVDPGKVFHDLVQAQYR